MKNQKFTEATLENFLTQYLSDISENDFMSMYVNDKDGRAMYSNDCYTEFVNRCLELKVTYNLKPNNKKLEQVVGTVYKNARGKNRLRLIEVFIEIVNQ
jgi:hypothetical protein